MTKLHIFCAIIASSLLSFFLFGMTEDGPSNPADNRFTGISNCEELIALGSQKSPLEGYYAITNNIDCTGYTLSTIKSTFTGVLDGKRIEGGMHKIANLTLQGNGLFEQISTPIPCIGQCGPKISNIEFEHLTVYPTSSDTLGGLLAAQTKGDEQNLVVISEIKVTDLKVIEQLNPSMPRVKSGAFGALIGSSKYTHFSDITLDNVTVDVDERNDRGGVVGNAFHTQMKNITVLNDLVLTGEHNTLTDLIYYGSTGGVAGIASESTFSNIHLLGTSTIKRNYYAGGIIGKALRTVSIENAEVKNIQPESGNASCAELACAMGGLIGYIDDLDINDVPVTTDVTIRSSVAKGELKSQFNTGGLIGYISISPTVRVIDSYSIVRLENPEDSRYAGGIIGKAEEGSGNGIITLQKVYAAGHIQLKGDNAGRAIIGHETQNDSVRISSGPAYFDKSAEGTDKDNSGDSISIALSHTQALDPNSYVGFENSKDSDGNLIWVLNNNSYPKLAFESP